MNRLEILAHDFVDDVERYCLCPGVWRNRNAYRAYVIETCQEIHRGGASPDETTAEALRAVLLAIAPAIAPPGRAILGMEFQNILMATQLSAEWRSFVDECCDDLDIRSRKWAASINVGGMNIGLGDWIDDKHYDTVTLEGSKPKPPTHGMRRKGRRR